MLGIAQCKKSVPRNCISNIANCKYLAFVKHDKASTPLPSWQRLPTLGYPAWVLRIKMSGYLD